MSNPYRQHGSRCDAPATAMLRLIRAYFRGTLGRVDMKRGRLPSGPRWIAFLAIWGALRLINPWWIGVISGAVWLAIWARGRRDRLDQDSRRRATIRLYRGTGTREDVSRSIGL